MLVHIVSFGGAAVVGSRDLSIMAVSRAWGHGFSGLRRLHSLRPVSLCLTWSHPTFEPIVQQRPASSRHLRFIAHAAALEDSPDMHQRRGMRLSRAERYALVENFVMRHKEAHEGKFPSVNAIVKEIGGSRLIVKDIVDELEKNLKVHREGESQNMENNALDIPTKPQGRSGVEGLAGDPIESEEDGESLIEAEALQPSDDVNSAKSGSESLVGDEPVLNGESLSSSGPLKSRSTEVQSDPGLWRSLRNLGHQENQAEAQQEQKVSAEVGDYYSEEDDDDDDEDYEDEDGEALDYTPETYHTSKEARRQDGFESHPKSASRRHPSDFSTGESYGLFIRFLPLAASEVDLRAAFDDCGEIVRAQAMVPRGTGLKFTYGFVDFSTPEALTKALKKDKVMVKGSTILTEACSGSRRTPESRAGARLPKPAPEHYKKSETYRTSDRNSDGRTINGARGLPTNRLKSHSGTENAFKTSTNGSYLVAVEGLPYPMPISAVEKMLSAHGGISRSELAREDGGTYSAHVEFKTEEARDSALAASRVYLGGRWCRITTGEPILTTVVRLSNVGNASESFILQRCGKVGRVDNIVQRKEGVVDVYYHPSERRNMRKILDRLGDVNADFKRWHANLAPKCSLEEIRNSAEVQDWVEGQKCRLLDNLTGAMKSLLIDLEDLRELIDAESRDVSDSGKSRIPDRSTVKPNRS